MATFAVGCRYQTTAAKDIEGYNTVMSESLGLLQLPVVMSYKYLLSPIISPNPTE
jgi:hypothetical protein